MFQLPSSTTTTQTWKYRIDDARRHWMVEVTYDPSSSGPASVACPIPGTTTMASGIVAAGFTETCQHAPSGGSEASYQFGKFRVKITRH
jgi:hypothetical protein